MSSKPVYMAGQGFMSDAQPPRPRLRPWLLPALLAAVVALAALWVLWGRGGEAPRSRVQVLSTPAGAEILLDLHPTGKRTPAQLDLPTRGSHRLQVRLAGYVPTPLILRLDGKELPAQVEFRLEPQPTATQTVEPQDLDESPPVSPPAVGLAPLLETSRRTPSGVGERPVEPLGLRFRGWDPAFRLKVDGRQLDPVAARQLPPGAHRVQVEGAGRVLLDTLLAEVGPVDLVLPPRERFVEVRVEPEQAEIVAGDRLLGRGRALLWRDDLPLAVRFPPLPGLLPPQARTVPRASPDLRLRHQATLRFQWTPAGPDGLALTQAGYRMPGQPFTKDESRGPRRDAGGLLLGRAFHDRRPGGAQAVRFEFTLPDGAHTGWGAHLELEAKDSGRRFPLVLTRGARLSLWLNGTQLARDQVLDETLDVRSWPVGNLLKPGSNELEVSSSEEARSASLLTRVTMKVGP
jgi:hypothetical protein